MAKKSNYKIETFDEYKARGGTVTIVPKNEHKSVDHVKSLAPPVPKLLSLEEADLLYGPQKKVDPKKKKKTQAKIDLNALPPALREKFLAKIQEAEDGESFEKESYSNTEEVEEEDSDEADS